MPNRHDRTFYFTLGIFQKPGIFLIQIRKNRRAWIRLNFSVQIFFLLLVQLLLQLNFLLLKEILRSLWWMHHVNFPSIITLRMNTRHETIFISLMSYFWLNEIAMYTRSKLAFCRSYFRIFYRWKITILGSFFFSLFREMILIALVFAVRLLFYIIVANSLTYLLTRFIVLAHNLKLCHTELRIAKQILIVFERLLPCLFGKITKHSYVSCCRFIEISEFSFFLILMHLAYFWMKHLRLLPCLKTAHLFVKLL